VFVCMSIGVLPVNCTASVWNGMPVHGPAPRLLRGKMTPFRYWPNETDHRRVGREACYVLLHIQNTVLVHGSSVTR